MASYIPESKQLLNRRTAAGWDAHYVCKTLILWYPGLLRSDKVHVDMRNPRKAMEFLSCLQDYPADLQDILILLAQRYGIHKATLALDNAIRKFGDEKPATGRKAGEERPTDDHPDRLTA